MRIVLIGLGGVGTILVNRLCRFINYAKIEILKDIQIHLIDGDTYEEKNYERQEFLGFGNKAEMKAKELERIYKKVKFSTFNEYLNQTNVSEHIQNGDVVCLCVDNHATRKFVSDYCATISNITLISGGNEWTDGNVQIFVRRDNKNLTPTLTMYHPEIDNPDDRSPENMSCEELANSEPQLYFANLSVATFMCWAFWNIVIENNIEESEIYFDIGIMTARPVIRAVK